MVREHLIEFFAYETLGAGIPQVAPFYRLEIPAELATEVMGRMTPEQRQRWERGEDEPFFEVLELLDDELFPEERPL